MYIIWELPNKSLAVTQVLGGRDANVEIEKIQSEHPEFTHKMTTANTTFMMKMPLDMFFSAIEIDESNEPVYNMVKARNIWRDKIRTDRYKKLKELDVEFQKAFETNDSVKIAEITSKKNILRDAPNDPAIDAANTLKDLKEVYPELLK